MFWNVNLFRFVKIIVVRITNVDVKIALSNTYIPKNQVK